ncbi:MAG: ATP-binding cassette domain-containing protein [Chloroflexi bacterium]|nr:ATP-binding cassette domain-containing protein [Chloroflexota bacterium]
MPPTDTSSTDGAPVLVVRDLSFTYPDGQPGLRDVSLALFPGERVALVGPNGAGKSTLMLHLNGILRGHGDIQVLGLPVVEQHLPSIRAQIGLVFQNPDDQLFSPTVFEDVAFGPLHMGLMEEEVCVRAARALNQVGMAGYAERLSYHLSVGEKKRIAIATVLAMEPVLLALDEPTAGLDPRARRTLIRLLADLPVSALVATHDMRLVQELLPRTVIMDEGRIVADGPSDIVLRDAALLEQHGLEAP